MAVEVIEHTADIGIHVTAPTVERLFAESGAAITSLIIENPEAVEFRQTAMIELAAEDVETLFIDWLRELIYRFDTDHLLFRSFSIRITEGDRRLHARCRGERADWTRHRPDHELKAVTYHGLRVARTEAGWEATVIFDV